LGPDGITEVFVLDEHIFDLANENKELIRKGTKQQEEEVPF
jgi:hypothetical protein